MFSSRKSAAPSGGYNLSKSLRFRSSASAYLNRTPASTTNRQIWTWSAWVKQGSALNSIFSTNASDNNSYNYFGFDSNAFRLYQWNGGSYDFQFITTPVYRDPAAWYHFVIQVDTTQATAANRVRLYVNGIQVTAFSTNTTPSQNLNTYVNNSSYSHLFARNPAGSSTYFDGYLDEINFIDGQALTPTSFGSFNALTGVWQPAKYTGTYGTNGFYLPFTNTTSTSTLGNDFSGNSNTWTVNNISLTAGATYDSMTDVPTLTSATTANYCVWNPLDDYAVTVTNGNLTIFPTVDTSSIRGTMGLPLSGKFYWETTVDSLGYGSGLGIASASSILSASASSAETRTYQWGSWFNSFNSGVVQYGTNQGITSGTNWSGASQLAANDVLMIAVDMTNGSMWVGKNGTWFNSSGTANPATNTDPRWTGLGGTTWFPYFNGYNFSGVTSNTNFGQRPFSYTPPTGFVALNTFNLPTPTIGATAATTANKYMNIALYTGTGSSQSITGLGFQPDWTWIKSRSGATDHGLYDAVRGVQNQLESNNTDAETTETTGLTAFGSDGFTVGALAQLNTSSATYVGWNWKAGGTAVTNNDGNRTSQVSANTTSGFSVVTYTFVTSGTNTVGHGLGVAPAMIIMKDRTTAYNWDVYHQSVGYTQRLILNSTSAATSGFWAAAPTSSVFSVTSSMGNNNDAVVAYCFAEVAGYSAFGSYTGNGSTDGTFVYTGFRPKFVLMKATTGSNNWIIYDTVRNTYNLTNLSLVPDSSAAENGVSTTTENTLDILSNGFKLRTSNALTNGSSVPYIYMAFAENPFKYANAR